MSKPKEIQQLEAGLSESGKKQLEEIKAAVGLYGDRDPALSTFVALQSILDRFMQFGPKFADTVRQSAHEARSDAVKAGEITMAAVIEKQMAGAIREITASHAAAMRELTVEATQVIRSAQPPTKNWRLWASLALLVQVGLLAAVGSASWWYRGHQASEATAWAQSREGKQAAEFYQVIKENIPDQRWLSSAASYAQLRDIIRWASTEAGIHSWQDARKTKVK